MNTYIRGRDRGSYYENGKKHYFKRNDADVEILMEKVCDLFGLKHAHYTPTTVDGLNYYISDDLNQNGSFTTAYDAGLESHHILDIRDFLLTHYPEDFDSLMDSVMKMYFMDLLTLNIDRNNENWGFITNNGHTELCLLDNDLAFIYENSLMTSCENPKRESFLEVKNIIDTFPSGYISLFQEMYDLLDCDTLEFLMRETEDALGKELPHKNNYMRRFELFQWKINTYLKRKQKEYQKEEI